MFSCHWHFIIMILICNTFSVKPENEKQTGPVVDVGLKERIHKVLKMNPDGILFGALPDLFNVSQFVVWGCYVTHFSEFFTMRTKHVTLTSS